MKYLKILKFLAVYFVLFTFFSGCALVIQKGRRSDLERIKALEQELAELRSARSLLEDRLSEEIGDSRVKLEMKEKGLVITVLAEVLFDSGKSELRKDSLPILDKVSVILNDQLVKHNIGIEGHTDNEPIKYSRWKDNWELSLHRAYSVLKYLESRGIDSDRLSAGGYGEYQPVASNETKEGKQLNRRVEIVVLPRLVKKLELGEDSGGILK